jgi:hypothetical protein
VVKVMPKNEKVRKETRSRSKRAKLPRKVQMRYRAYMSVIENHLDEAPWSSEDEMRLDGELMTRATLDRLDGQIRALKAERQALKDLRKAIAKAVNRTEHADTADPADNRA